MARSLSFGWPVLAVALGFVACGGTSTLHRSVPRGTGDDDDDMVVGSGGSGARAGTPGKGGTGATSNGVGGSTVSAGGTGAKGGSTGKGGSTAKGGSPGKGGSLGGGTGGIGGEAGTLNVDPDCTCTEQALSVSCSTSKVTVPSGFAYPASCMLLDTQVKREYCDDGSTHYTFLEGGENDYELEIDASGTATYFRASGYIAPGCGLDPHEFSTATVTRGTPSDAACFEGCALCGEYEGLPACEACERDPNHTDTALETLEQFCSRFTCPASYAELRAQAGVCGSEDPPQLNAGCGLIRVTEVFGFSELTFAFDASTGALVGAHFMDDLPRAPCHTSAYVAGTISNGPCSTLESCNFCTLSGEAGAGNTAGAGGAADGAFCPIL